ncbi:MAG: putative toxin-antitoxin system toxin component, PIN family [Candidatus Symbiothrix sp.]|jgi:putative PIN family toxin of toxin-antitoxin system|nr:putative toxin-antitoxin system toxin component, PIN family [Candidatus Symbiothrix sp.]
MQKIILDTNVVVSALIQKNYPYYILYDYVFGNKVRICLSDELMQEYIDVLNRPKFSKYPDFLDKAQLVLTDLISRAKKYEPVLKLNIINDQSDNKLLELADISKADFLITGNTNDFTMSNYKNTIIITPREYWELQI